MKLLHLLPIAMIAAFAVTACDADDGPGERTGRTLDETGEEVRESIDDAGNAIEEACEDVREGVDADDTDC